MRRENDKLMGKLREYENNDSMSPTSGDNGNLKRKIAFFEKTVREMEKELSLIHI